MGKRRVSVLLILCMLLQVVVSGVGMPAYGAPVDEFEQMRLAYYNYLTGGDDYDLNDEAVQQKIELTDSSAAAHYGDGEWYNDFVEKKIGALDFEAPCTDEFLIGVGRLYQGLYAMALSYRTEGSDFYGDKKLGKDIANAIEAIYQAGYDENYEYGGNWWRYKVGIPGTVVDLVVLMYDDMTEEQIKHQMDALHAVIPVVNDTEAEWQGENAGTNLIWKAFRVMLCGIITKDGNKIEMAKEALGEGFRYKDGSSGDGMYKDGSFMFHSWIPYNMGYGLSQMADVASIMRVLAGSSWETDDPDEQNLYDWVETAFEPFMYQGYSTPMVSGREVSRDACIENGGYTYTKTLIMMLDFAPEEYLDDYKSMIKTNLEAYEEDGNLLAFYKALPLYYIPVCDEIRNDSSIAPWEIKTEARNYASMDRMLQRNPDYTVGIAMHSRKTKIFESNNEWVNGFHTANGMTYVTTKEDPEQFGRDYFLTVDPYKLPGTTINTRKRDLTKLDNDNPNIPKPWIMNNQGRFVGASTLDSYMAAGMYLTDLKPTNTGFTQAETTMTAQKSWFLFDNEIVALGAGIQSSDTENHIQTIIENRKLKKDGSNTIVADGAELPSESFKQETDSVNWINLEGMGGYYFPETQKVALERYVRRANTYETNIIYGKPTDYREDNYFSIIKDHGTAPESGGYEYVILPGVDVSETGTYAQQPDITIVANTDKIQMAKDETIGMTGANFWENKTASAGFLRSTRKASVMVKEEGTGLTAAVSEPTMEYDGPIYLEINRSAKEVKSQDAAVKVISMEPTIKLEVTGKGLGGQSAVISFEEVGEGIDEDEFLAGDELFENSLLSVKIKKAEEELRALAEDAVTGKEDGMYPAAAKTCLLECADELSEIAEKPDLTGADVDEALDMAETAKNIFKTSVITDQNTIIVSEDTYIRLGTKPESLDENHGSDKTLAVKTQSGWLDGNRKILLKFHIGDNGRAIKSAKLYLTGSPTAEHVVNRDCEPFFIQKVADNSWKENVVTGRTAPSIGDVITRGETPPKTRATLEYDVTEYIRETYANGTVSMAVVQDAAHVEGNGGAYYTISSKENDKDVPVLVIEYDSPAGDIIGKLEKELKKLAEEAPVGQALSEYPKSAVERLVEAADELAELGSQEEITAQDIQYAKELAERSKEIFKKSRIQKEITIQVDEDTFIRSGASNGTDCRDENHGLDKVAEIKTDNGWPAGNRIMLMKFMLGSSELPIKSAKLHLTGVPTAADVVDKDCEPLWIHQMDDSSWSETTVTWNTAPDIGDVIAKGGTPPKTEGVTTYDVTDYIEANSSGGMVSMAVIQDVPEGGGVFYKVFTKENGSKSAYLEIEYDLKECEVEVTATPSNAGKVSGAGTVGERTKHTVTAEAKDGFYFVKWTSGGEQVSTASEYTFTVLDDTSLTAWFEEGKPETYQITVKASPSNAGKVTGSGKAIAGTMHTITAEARKGWEFIEWIQDGDSVSDEAEYTFEVTENAAFWAMFEEAEPDDPDVPDNPDDPDDPDDSDDPDNPAEPDDPDDPDFPDNWGGGSSDNWEPEVTYSEVLNGDDLRAVPENSWFMRHGRWYYLGADGKVQTGWFLDGQEWYYFNNNGVMQTGWIKVGENWYYLEYNGKMRTGWILYQSCWYYLKPDGSMETGWILSNGMWYYLSESGRMVTEQYVDGYYLDRNGVWREENR